MANSKVGQGDLRHRRQTEARLSGSYLHRAAEVRSHALDWGDLHLDEVQPFALFCEGTMKDNAKRAVLLRAEIAAALREARPKDVEPTKKVFWFNWPAYDILKADFEKAGIVNKDVLGSVVHFHSFRKTWQTLGVWHGVNPRATQEILGHSDPSLTANVYTDVPALSLQRRWRNCRGRKKTPGVTP
ncbi:MAG: tyrosine-type recombinase/integrase [Opitutaceae bacterium]